MPTLIYRPGVGLVDKATGEKATFAEFRPVAPMIVSDLPDYRSPMTGEVISGRSARREDLKKHNCVEVDPSSGPGGFKNERFARKWGLRLKGE